MQFLLWYRNTPTNRTLKNAGIAGLQVLCEGGTAEDHILAIK